MPSFTILAMNQEGVLLGDEKGKIIGVSYRWYQTCRDEIKMPRWVTTPEFILDPPELVLPEGMASDGLFSKVNLSGRRAIAAEVRDDQYGLRAFVYFDALSCRWVVFNDLLAD
jgi:hypothetical protein